MSISLNVHASREITQSGPALDTSVKNSKGNMMPPKEQNKTPGTNHIIMESYNSLFKAQSSLDKRNIQQNENRKMILFANNQNSAKRNYSKKRNRHSRVEEHND